MQASVFEISIFPLVLQIPVSRRIHIGEECVHVYAQNIESDLLAEGVSGDRGKGERERERNVRVSRHRRTLRLHPIPRFYSLIPLCSPPSPSLSPWEPGRLLFLPSHLDTDVPTSTTLALPSRPSSSSRVPSSPLAFALSRILSFLFSLSLFLRLLQLPSGSSLQVVAAIPSPGPPHARHPFCPLFVTLSATATRAHSLVRISNVVDTSQYCLKNHTYIHRQIRAGV